MFVRMIFQGKGPVFAFNLGQIVVDGMDVQGGR